VIFTISPREDIRLPYHKKINDHFSFHSLQPLNDNIIGWQFPPLGGNFIQLTDILDGIKIRFSFYKDFDLYADHTNDVLISNDPRYKGVTLDNDIIGIDVIGNSFQLYRMDWKTYLNPNVTADRGKVLAALKNRLLHNIDICASIGRLPTSIVYTGGLDSSLVAFLFNQTGRPFQCIINEDWKNLWPDLPFQSISYRKPSISNHRWASKEHTKISFYESDLTDCLTGFFGDTAMLHNNDLYHQCTKLIDISGAEIYDKTSPADYPKFHHHSQVYAAIVKIMKTTRFQQWFENFRILDPYRDPNLTAIILELSWSDLTSQFGSAWVQKEMITQIDPSFLSMILKNKNEYPIQ
jgi:hypothetical protein